MELNHTALPYEFKPTAVYDAVYSADGELICFAAQSEMARKNAKFIARACNAHDDLVGALRLILSQSIGEDWTARQAFDFMRKTARDAIEKAGAKS